MKLLQVSDLHLERPYEGIYDEQNQFYKHLQYLNENVFADIIQIAIEKKVDAVLFCGDTFHQSQISLKTQSYFLKGLSALQKENIQVVLTFGNHDYYTPTKFWFDFPENVMLFTSEEVEVKDLFLPLKNQHVKIVGFSYTNRWITDNKLAKYPKKDREVTIGIYHGSEKTGDEKKDRYAPFLLNDMRRLQYDYFALGHIHVPQVKSFEPPIVYGGTPQGHSRKETKVKGVVLVEILENQPTTYEFVPVENLVYTEKQLSLMEKHPHDYLTIIENFLQESLNQVYQIVSLTLEIPKEVDVDCEDLLYYLRKTCEKKNWPLYVNELEIKAAEDKKISLPLTSQVLESYEKIYQAENFFKEEFQELYQIPALKEVVDAKDFQQQGILEAVEKLTKKLVFEEDDHAHH